MTIKNGSQERDNLHRTIWRIANDLRGSVDGWDFKTYILGTLFYRYVSENMERSINDEVAKANESGDKIPMYKDMSDEYAERVKGEMLRRKGYFIKPSDLFSNVVKTAHSDPNLNETLEQAFRNFEISGSDIPEAREKTKGLFDDYNVNNNKLGPTVAERNKKLAKILQAVNDLDLGYGQDNTIDAFGDAYEYLMGMYAANAGKSGGEYYTPQEVSLLLAKLTMVNTPEFSTVYDPTCGSGSLLLSFTKLLEEEQVKDITFKGQELNVTTYNLGRINMFLHDINFSKFDIRLGDTLMNPRHDINERFDIIVSNPPYSIKWEGKKDIKLTSDERFTPAGVLAPSGKADLAFIMHTLYHLNEKGTAAIVCFPGILYRRGAEQKIRKYLVENGYVDAIISLPENLFFGTSISTSIMVLRKSKKSNNVLFIDASKEFTKATNNNILTDENISKIVESYKNGENSDYFAYSASLDEIKEEDYNLSVSTYVEKEDTREVIDIKQLNKEIDETVAKIDELRKSIKEIIKEIEEDEEEENEV